MRIYLKAENYPTACGELQKNATESTHELQHGTWQKSWTIEIIMAIFGHFMVKLYLNNMFNSLIDFSASDWYNKIPISLF